MIVAGISAVPLRARFEAVVADRMMAFAWWEFANARASHAIVIAGRRVRVIMAAIFHTLFGKSRGQIAQIAWHLCGLLSCLFDQLRMRRQILPCTPAPDRQPFGVGCDHLQCFTDVIVKNEIIDLALVDPRASRFWVSVVWV